MPHMTTGTEFEPANQSPQTSLKASLKRPF
jgi:hypothetical protein